MTRPTRTSARRRIGPFLLPVLLFAGIGACGGADSGEEGTSYEERVQEEHRGDRPRASRAAEEEPRQEVTTGEVTYGEVAGDSVTGYLARPTGAPNSLPAVIVIHEWWGLNDNIRAMARRLAGEGYQALAVDLYGGRVAETPARARELTSAVEGAEARANLRQAYGYLVSRGARRMGSIGWCFGGGWSLRTALTLPDRLDAAVIYYGRVVTDAEQLSDLQLPVQGHFGAEDSSIPPEDAKAFEQALTKAGVANEIYVYEGAGHAFANPSGERYRPEAAKRAWVRTVEFLGRTLQDDAGPKGG